MRIIINIGGFEMRHDNPWLKERLAAGGFRNTEPRRIILDILSRTSKHLTAEDIYFLVRGMNPSIGFATVYRTLDLLTRMGIVQKFDFGEGKSRYELIQKRNKEAHHYHLLCTRCKKIFDYEDLIDEEKDLIRKTEETLSKKYGFIVESHIIYFYGICSECGSHLHVVK